MVNIVENGENMVKSFREEYLIQIAVDEEVNFTITVNIVQFHLTQFHYFRNDW